MLKGESSCYHARKNIIIWSRRNHGRKCYHLEQILSCEANVSCKSLHVIMRDEMLSYEANVIK
jgi:hypothetical protein